MPSNKGFGRKKLSFENTFDRMADFASLRPALRSRARKGKNANLTSVSDDPQPSSDCTHKQLSGSAFVAQG